MFEPVKNLMEDCGYTVHAEVNSCDVVAVKNDEIIGIEMKKSFNATLLIQAVNRQRVIPDIYLAFPHPGRGIFKKKWHKICYLIKRLELGLILVKFTKNYPEAEFSFHPGPKVHYRSRKKKESLLKELSGRSYNQNTGGTTREKIMTAYRESSIFIACCLERFGPLSPKKLRELGTSVKTGQILYRNFYGWFEKVSYGLYSLHTNGKEALSEYKGTADIYYKRISSVEEDE